MKYIIGVVGFMLILGCWYFYKANYPIVVGRVTDLEMQKVPNKATGGMNDHVKMKIEIHHFYKNFKFDISKKRPAEMSFRGIGKDFTEIGIGDIIECKVTEDIKTTHQVKILKKSNQDN